MTRCFTAILTIPLYAALSTLTLAQDQRDPEPGPLSWSSDLTAAKAAAAAAPGANAKPILVKFTGSDWCSWCQKLEAEVFEKPAFRRWATDRVVLVEIDFPRSGSQTKAERQRNRELARHYGVRGYPTVLLLDHTGRKLGTLGYEPGGAGHWTDLAEAELRAAAPPTWHTDHDTALAEARKTGRPLLVNFTGSDWCHWCVRLRQEVLATPEFSRWARSNVVLLEVDFPRRSQQTANQKRKNRELAKRHGVRGYPTIVLLDHDGKRRGQLGYVKGGPTTWLAKAQAILSIRGTD